ncbi:TRAP transporter substrate-binding protein DctP [Nesterenkonia muleiensis]|uniref:TRAP transporter substrate-binding protein DctP n=1 Tax=Nesterenkonia muleiensis TaxID=2282648 RepID=UPI000E76887B|nr:TRAP transporter substrate-binding protein DctP [Nesterenkonia muleiensis]
MRIKNNRSLLTAGALSTSLALLVGCGGSIGDQSNGAGTEGFDYGASQEDVDEVLADLEPVTLDYQAYASSPNADSAAEARAMKDAIEERSGGKITINIHWGESIVSYTEVDSALTDGRLDLAYNIAIYSPAEYPILDNYSKLSHYAEAGPLTGELVTQATMTEAAWNDPEFIEEFTSKGQVPLNLLGSSGNYTLACNSPRSSAEDWAGTQIRIGGSAQVPISESIGASPVSLESGEVFEGLQRGTVDCAWTNLLVAGETGLLEAAPHVTTLDQARTTSVVNIAHVAGSSFEQLPLPYQQIIFDVAGVDWLHGQIEGVMRTSTQAVQDVQDAGGDFTEPDPQIEEQIFEAQEQIVEEMIEDDLVDENLPAQLRENSEKWAEVVEELGYTDDGELSNLDEWYDPESVDFRPLFERVYEEAALNHRPS